MIHAAIKLMAIAGLLLFAQTMASAAPIPVGAPLGTPETNPLLHDVRLYCMNARTGRFLYWGRCGGRRYVRRYSYRPVYYRRARVRWFCRNRYTGRFLYWGRCR